MPEPVTRRDLDARAALAVLNGFAVARCAHCGLWEPAGLYIDKLCDGCSNWYSQWRRLGDGDWVTLTEVE